MEEKEPQTKISLSPGEIPVFALDIGTRSVVGILGTNQNGIFHVLDYEQRFHPERAMRDGQIENIELVAGVVSEVKAALESRWDCKLQSVAIAAAGRALKTKRVTYEQELDPTEEISQRLVQAMEYGAVAYAQDEFFKIGILDPDPLPFPLPPAQTVQSGANTLPEEATAPVIPEEVAPRMDASTFFCVGYSVVSYQLDRYPMDSLVGQKGRTATIDLIAAFLPQNVVEGLYAVTRLNNLSVENLTLEPIAAIHVIVPKDIRLLNIAIVDIGAGTSDIAISKGGSIVAYDMATTAGDEITESIMQNYLTSFSESEHIKISLSDKAQNTVFHDILGNEHKIEKRRIIKTIRPAISALADAICRRILAINEIAPLAVFLIGGGSQIPELCQLVAQKLGLPSHRVAVGGNQPFKNISLCSEALQSPEFITPIGIGAVSSFYTGCDFFSITVNGKRLMLLNYGDSKVMDALLLASIKPKSLIGVSSKSLAYTINGERQVLRGSCATPGELYVNNTPASIDTRIKQGDEIMAIPAVDGSQPSVTAGEILEKYAPLTVFLNGEEITYTPILKKRGRILKKSYQIQPLDALELPVVRTAGELLQYLERDLYDLELWKNGQICSLADLLADGDILETRTPEPEPSLEESYVETPPAPSLQTEAFPELSSAPPIREEPSSIYSAPEATVEDPVQEASAPAPTEAASSNAVRVSINDAWIMVEKNESGKVFFFDLLNYVDIDPKHPQGSIILRLNGKDAAYTDPIHDNDVIEIFWA